MLVLLSKPVAWGALVVGLILGYLSLGTGLNVALSNPVFTIALLLVVYGVTVGLGIVSNLVSLGWILLVLGVALLLVGYLTLQVVLWIPLLIGIVGLVLVLGKGVVKAGS